MDNAMIDSLIPFIIAGGTSIVVMLLIAVRRLYMVSWTVTILGLAAALFADIAVPATGMGGPLFMFDTAARYFEALVLIVNILVGLLSYRYFQGYPENREEFHLLLLLETIGSLMLVSSANFVSFIIGLELLSVPLYAMLGYVRNRDLPLEAATKYFILTAVASAILVFGLGLVYFETGSLALSSIGRTMSNAGAPDTVLIAGLVLVLGGLSFKLAVFPFHMWAADVYEGSPLPATAVISTVSKIAVFAFLYRFFLPIMQLHSGSGALSGGLVVSVIVLAVGSMLAGNFLALKQTNIKRILAYSSTANLGYLLIPLVTGAADSAQAAFFYLSIYAFTNIGVLGVLTAHSSHAGEQMEMDSYTGLLYRRPFQSIVFILMMLSLAGLPISAGFFGKLYLFKTAVNGSQWVLTAVFVAASAIGLYYYLKLVYVQITRKQSVGTGKCRRHR